MSSVFQNHEDSQPRAQRSRKEGVLKHGGRKCSYPATCVGNLAKKHLPSCGDDGNLPLVEKKEVIR